jgi:phosphotransferase system HPr (HPr) family protein
MKEKTIILKAPNGLHARPASDLVKLAASFKSSVFIENLTTRNKVNAKSILQMLTLAAPYGTELMVLCTGPDEDDALGRITDYLAELQG